MKPVIDRRERTRATNFKQLYKFEFSSNYFYFKSILKINQNSFGFWFLNATGSYRQHSILAQRKYRIFELFIFWICASDFLFSTLGRIFFLVLDDYNLHSIVQTMKFHSPKIIFTSFWKSIVTSTSDFFMMWQGTAKTKMPQEHLLSQLFPTVLK